MAGALIRNAIETGAPLYNASHLAFQAAFVSSSVFRRTFSLRRGRSGGNVRSYLRGWVLPWMSANIFIWHHRHDRRE